MNKGDKATVSKFLRQHELVTARRYEHDARKREYRITDRGKRMVGNKLNEQAPA